MPRDIPVGNGSLLVNFDGLYQLRDFYWPHVGQENHSEGHPFRFGVWVEDQFRWVHSEGWQRSLDYVQGTLVTEVTLSHPGLALTLICNDAVDFHENLYIRKVTVRNEADRQRQVRLFFAHDFHIYGNQVGDTAYYESERRAVFHYKGKRWFLINGGRECSADDWEFGLDQWATGTKEAHGKEGTWRDAEDGWLSGNPVAQGSIDSCVALHCDVPANGEATVYYWIAVGSDFREVTRINRAVRERTPQTFLDRTRDYWALWVTKGELSLGRGPTAGLRLASDDPLADILPRDVCRLYRRSLLVLRTQIDNGGAIVAANDFDIAQFGRDTYSYMWPRDGALVAAALIEARYSEIARRFFSFCHQIITDEGYFLHKYTPDGSLGSSWHPWYQDGQKVLPVQEDETALVLWALWRHFDRFRDIEFIKVLYRGLIIRAAEWLADYRDRETGLPLPSWDLWEERRGVLAFTVGATWAGLQAAANFAAAFGEQRLAAKYRQAADEIKAATEAHLWRPEANRFVRMINRRADGGWDVDLTVDASLHGLWYFGMYPPDDARIVATMETVKDQLWVKTDVGGVARYENDYYHQMSQDIERVPGNPWFICTLWLAQWYIAKAETPNDPSTGAVLSLSKGSGHCLKPALDLLNWTAAHALPSGVLAEQVHPYTNAPLSVSPLTWSHATVVMTVLEYLRRLAELQTAPQ